MKMKIKYAVAISILIMLLLSGTQLLFSRSDDQKNSIQDYWQQMATQAWDYYQPGKALNTQTGLHGAGLEWPYFTEWDLGTYIQALIDARDIGLLKDDGQWGFNHRIDKIMIFLKTRELTSNNEPYLVYDSRNGNPHERTPTFDIDEGKLYLALYNLKTAKPDLTQEINYIVKERHNNTNLIPLPQGWANANTIYCYYVSHAFKAFEFPGWETVPDTMINHIVSKQKITTYGVQLPTANICGEPLLLTFFDVNPQNSNFTWLLSQVNQALEARYTATGYYTAFSEGNTGLNDPGYVYEYIVDYDGTPWKVAPNITPITYLKIAAGFHAIFNTDYTKNMVEHIRNALSTSTNGFQEGMSEDGRTVNIIIDRTNGLIISAAKYVLENNLAETPSPSAISTQPPMTATPIAGSSPDSSPSSIPTPTSIIESSNPSPSASTSPSPSSSPNPTVTPAAEGKIDPLMVASIVGVACLSLFIVLMVRRRRNGTST